MLLSWPCGVRRANGTVTMVAAPRYTSQFTNGSREDRQVTC